MTGSWKEIDHTADWAIEVTGDDLRDLFEQSAIGMTTLMGGQVEETAEQITRDFTISGAPDLETLLVDWLNELVFLVEDEAVVCESIHVRSVENLVCKARITGWSNGVFGKHIKAVTYQDINIHTFEDGVRTVVVFDV